MSTTIRPEISTRNKYWIDKHRYYELKHFCLQYPLWKRTIIALDGFIERPSELLALSKTNVVSDPTAKCAELRLFYSERIEMVERTAVKTDSVLSNYILQAVTQELSYDKLKVKSEIPCCKDSYYELYRRFFWLLSKARA